MRPKTLHSMTLEMLAIKGPRHGWHLENYCVNEAILSYLDQARYQAKELVLEPGLFFQFAQSLGNMRGTVYPFQDGGIRYAGPLGWVIVKPGYDG
jgi:hypothetical protein